MIVTAETVIANHPLATQYLSPLELEEKEKKNQISLLSNKETKQF
jgi:hypothetical protein